MGIVLYVSDTEKITYETKPRKEKRHVWINSTCNNIDRNHSSRLRHRFCHCLRYGKLRNRKPREGKRTKGENAMVPFITGIMCAGIAISTLFMWETRIIMKVQRCDVKWKIIMFWYIFCIICWKKVTLINPAISAFLAGWLLATGISSYSAARYRRLSFSSRKTNRTNLRAVNASARLCWCLFTSLYLEW